MVARRRYLNVGATTVVLDLPAGNPFDQSSSMRFAYNTNGCSNHRLGEALRLMADCGYDGVALTLDHHHFDPFAERFEHRCEELRSELERLGLGIVVETGARFLLDPAHKHEPTLLHPTAEGRARRLEFLQRALDVARICDGETMSFWAGVPPTDAETAVNWARLVDGVQRVVEYAESTGAPVPSLEPEPGMAVETVDDLARLRRDAALTTAQLRLALDVGHCLVTGDREPAAAVTERADELGTLSIEDMRRGKHVHLPFGQGDLDLPGTLRAIDDCSFDGLICVELSRESPRAHQAIPESLAALRAALPGT